MVSVVIVGAGAAGLLAAKTLQAASDVEVVILEAMNRIGGRLKKGTIANESVDLGGQWIHPSDGESATDILSNILQGSDTPTPQNIVKHSYDPVQVWDGSEFYGETFDPQDYLWINSTWFDFFNDNVATQDVKDAVEYNCAVNNVNYAENITKISCQDGRIFSADHVILTPSIQVLQDEVIEFTPTLPSDVTNAIASYDLGKAFKAFFHMKTKFYPNAFVTLEECVVSNDANDRLFWSESFGEDTSNNILAVFAIGAPAVRYFEVSSDEEAFLNLMQVEIDEYFGEGIFQENYISHVIQDWSKEPYVRTGYTVYVQNTPGPIQTLASPIANGKLFFAGEGIPLNENWGFVHGAAYSGRRAANQIISLKNTGSATSSVDPSRNKSVAVGVVLSLLLASHLL